MKKMDTFTTLAVAAILCALVTGFVLVAFFAYGAGTREAYRRGLSDGAEIQRSVHKDAFGIPAEKLGGGHGI